MMEIGNSNSNQNIGTKVKHLQNIDCGWIETNCIGKDIF